MKELLDKIQSLIEKTVDDDVIVQRELLEPLFSQVYGLCREGDVNILDMLRISQLENRLTKRIIDVVPKVESSTSLDDSDKIIEQIVYYSRKKAEDIYQCSIKNDSLKSRSLDFCNIVLETSKNLGVASVIFNLSNILEIPIKHHIIISYINNRYYLIDITYQQFFLLGYNFKERYYEHPSYTKLCDIGGRMMDSGRECARKMIENGYLKDLNDIKKYFDAFMDFSTNSKLETGKEYLNLFLKTLKGSNDKSEKLLFEKANF